MSRSTTRYYLIGLVCVLLLSGCRSNQKNADVIHVALLRGPSAIAFAQWMEDDPVLDGRRFVVDILDSPEQMQAALIRKEPDIAVLPMISAANLYNKDVDYLLAGCPLWGTLYIVGREPFSKLHIFGAGTTPDILTRYYLSKTGKDYPLAYSYSTASEITQGLLANKIEAAVLSEPFVSMVLRQDSTIRLIADLNNPDNESMGFAQTAIMIHPSLAKKQDRINHFIDATCAFVENKPKEAIRILEKKGIFAKGMLTEDGLKRNKIKYVRAADAKEEILSFLQIIYEYEPKAIGGKVPDDGFIYGKP